MSDNPYSPPDPMSVKAESWGSTACTAIFWLSCVVCMIVFAIAANSGYQYWFYTLQGIKLSTSIIAETVCVALSGLGMLYSTIMWRRRLIRKAAVSLVGSLLVFFDGPLLM